MSLLKRKTATAQSESSTDAKPERLDPLYVIFEQYLYNFQESEGDRKTFVAKVVKEYLSYLRSMQILVPQPLLQPVTEELGEQVSQMLVKKIYGCLSIEEYQRQSCPTRRKKAKSRYARLKSSTP